jgi:hypothetical protein
MYTSEYRTITEKQDLVKVSIYIFRILVILKKQQKDHILRA